MTTKKKPSKLIIFIDPHGREARSVKVPVSNPSISSFPQQVLGMFYNLSEVVHRDKGLPRYYLLIIFHGRGNKLERFKLAC